MKKTIKIKGMHCKSCEMLIKSELEDIRVKAEINYESGKAVIEFDEKKINFETIIKVISDGGYSIE